jgi:hypothetical protein
MPNFSSELIEELFATRNLTEKRALLEEEFGEIIAEYKADPHFDFKSFDATIDDVRRAKYVSVDGYVMAHASDTHPYHYLYPMQIGGTVVKLKGGIYRAAGGNIELLTVQTWHEEEQLADRLSPDGKRKFDQIHKLFRLQTLFM